MRSGTNAPEASCSVMMPEGSMAMPRPALAAAAMATPLSALNLPCGLTVTVWSPSPKEPWFRSLQDGVVLEKIVERFRRSARCDILRACDQHGTQRRYSRRQKR